MTQGIYLDGRRPKSKKEIKTFVDAAYIPDPAMPNGYKHGEEEQKEILKRVRIEATSLFGDEFNGPLDAAPTTKTYTFVGPDPYTKRNFYGNIKWNEARNRWVVT